jgi:hypothetical protein
MLNLRFSHILGHIITIARCQLSQSAAPHLENDFGAVDGRVIRQFHLADVAAGIVKSRQSLQGIK